MNKKQLIYSILVLFLVGLIVAGGTFAYYSFTATNNKNISFNTSKELQNYIIYNEGESKFSGDFKVSSTYTEGMHSTISLYKTSEVSNIDLIATIKMDINEIGNNIKNSKAVKWVVTEGNSTNVGNVLSQGNFIGVNNNDTLTLVPNLEVTSTETFYTIWLWLDENENPSDNLTGETLDTTVWTEINQVEGVDDSFEITRVNANYQNISATVVNNKNKVSAYAVTTSNTEPSEWTSIDANNQSNVYNLDYSVSETGTYYVWIKDSEGNTISRSIEVTQIDTTAPVCTFGSFNPTAIGNNATSTIELTCIDTESSISKSKLTTSDISASSNAITITNISKTNVTNGYKYTITVTGTNNTGDATISLAANKITNAVDMGNDGVTSNAITVLASYVATIYYNSNATSGSTTISNVKATCTPTVVNGSCTVTIPTDVINSVGTYNNAYAGLNSSAGTMTPSIASNATTITLSASTNYFSIYSSPVNIITPSSETTCTTEYLYRNQYFSSPIAMSSTYLSSQPTVALTATPTTYTGYTFMELRSGPLATGTAYTVVSAATTNIDTFYERASKSISATFYYYDGSAQTSTTASGSKILACSSATAATSAHGAITVPTAVTNSTGPNNSPYSGVSTGTSSTSTTTTINTGTTTYYAVYGGTFTATFTKENNNVASISSSTLSCSSSYTTDGTTYSGTDCTIILPSITPATGYKSIGWYDSNDEWYNFSNAETTLTGNATFTAKAKRLVASELIYDNTNSGIECNDVQCMIDYLDTDNTISTTSLKPGDYVSYTPSKTSYTTSKVMTGYTSTQTINPSELNLWRVLSVNDDGTIDIISEYVSSTNVYFQGKEGYKNYVGYLNVLASQYETTGVTVGSRHFGYSNQTEYITSDAYFVNPAPWTCSTGGTCTPDPDDYEAYGGGDTGYLDDYNLVNTVLGTRVANTIGGSTSAYWMATRYYGSYSASRYGWSASSVDASGGNGGSYLYYYSSSIFNTYNGSYALRPIVTLKSGLSYTGSGTSASPWVIQ